MYVPISPELFFLIVWVTFCILMIMCLIGAIYEEHNKHRAHEQRITQMQVTKQEAQEDLTRLTQEYLERRKAQAQHGPHTRGERSRTQSRTE